MNSNKYWEDNKPSVKCSSEAQIDDAWSLRREIG